MVSGFGTGPYASATPCDCRPGTATGRFPKRLASRRRLMRVCMLAGVDIKLPAASQVRSGSHPRGTRACTSLCTSPRCCCAPNAERCGRRAVCADAPQLSKQACLIIGALCQRHQSKHARPLL